MTVTADMACSSTFSNNNNSSSSASRKRSPGSAHHPCPCVCSWPCYALQSINTHNWKREKKLCVFSIQLDNELELSQLLLVGLTCGNNSSRTSLKKRYGHDGVENKEGLGWNMMRGNWNSSLA